MKTPVCRYIGSLFTLVLLATLLLSAKDTTPAWVTDVKSAFPDSQYLAFRGSGSTAETARSDALFQLSTYINTSVEANLTTTISSSVTNGVVSDHTDISQIVSLSSSVSDLFALEFTDACYVKKEKTWYSVAYITRDAAFTRYQPVVEDARTAFQAAYQLAVEESDYLTRCWYLKEAWTTGREFLATLEYIQIIHPAKARQYQADRSTVTQIGAAITRTLKSSTYALNIDGDYGDMITSAVSNVLYDAGMTESRVKPVYTVVVTIRDNATTGSKTVSIAPSISLTIIDSASGEASYSFSYKAAEKETAYAIETAYKRCYPVLAESFAAALRSDFDATFRL